MLLGTNLEVLLKFNLATIIAFIAVESISMMWFGDNSPRTRQREGFRYLLTAVVCDLGLVIILQYIIDNAWEVTEWKGVAHLAIWTTLLYLCLQAPHEVSNSDSLLTTLLAALHKLTIIITAAFFLVYCKNVSL